MTIVPILSAITFFPLLGVVLIMWMAPKGAQGDTFARQIAGYTTVVTFGIALYAWYFHFDSAKHGFQMVEDFAWLGGPVHYR